MKCPCCQTDLTELATWENYQLDSIACIGCGELLTLEYDEGYDDSDSWDIWTFKKLEIK